jgi:hypothetical protein
VNEADPGRFNEIDSQAKAFMGSCQHPFATSNARWVSWIVA